MLDLARYERAAVASTTASGDVYTERANAVRQMKAADRGRTYLQRLFVGRSVVVERLCEIGSLLAACSRANLK